MIIQERINVSLDKWTIHFKNESNIRSMIAIPPTSGSRIDILLETKKDHIGGVLTSQKYLYNYKSNIKKLKGEKIIIKIENGIPTISYSKK